MLAKNIALAKAQEISERMRQEGRLTESVPGLGVNYTDKAVVPPQVSQVPQEELTTTTTSASHRDVNVTTTTSATHRDVHVTVPVNVTTTTSAIPVVTAQIKAPSLADIFSGYVESAFRQMITEEFYKQRTNESVIIRPSSIRKALP